MCRFVVVYKNMKQSGVKKTVQVRKFKISRWWFGLDEDTQ